MFLFERYSKYVSEMKYEHNSRTPPYILDLGHHSTKLGHQLRKNTQGVFVKELSLVACLEGKQDPIYYHYRAADRWWYGESARENQPQLARPIFGDRNVCAYGHAANMSKELVRRVPGTVSF